MKSKFAILGLLTLVLFVLSIYFGAVSIPFGDITGALTGRMPKDSTIYYIIMEGRLPKAVTALLSGGALGVSGLMLQTAFRNPLAGPSILGISSGAGLGVAIVMLAFGGTLAVGGVSFGGSAAVITGAFAGSLGVMALLIFFSMRVKNNLMLLITGMMTGYLTSSLVTLLSSLSTARGIQGYVVWGMGTFEGVPSGRLLFYSIFIIFGLGCSIALAKPLNILLLGDDYARSLGVRVGRVRNALLLVTGLLTAIVTAYCGPISFIGLAMPHIARMITKTDNHFVLIPATILSGSALALACNIVSVIPENNVIPLNALTPVVGVPVILYVILNRRDR